jgi:carboxypeptidase C (cathepsin A)
MKLMVCASYFDLATPYFQAQYALDHIGLHPETLKNITWQYYMAGHMMYIDKEQQAKLKRDEADFIEKAISQ